MFSTGKPLRKMFYLLGVVVIFLAVYSQYFVDFSGLVGYLVVYGIPVVFVSLFFGKEILRRSGKNNVLASKLGLGMFGALTLVGLFLSVIVIAILLQFDQSTMEILNKPNPVLQVPPNVAWVMILISFLVIGPAEEYLFRGFLFGGLLSITKGKHWLPLAFGSSVIFALIHAYYAVTYGMASVVPFISIMTFSIAMSLTYYYTGGNLVIPVLIHGVYDATGFLTVAVSSEVGSAARGLLIFVGVAFAIYFLLKKLLTGHALKGSLFSKKQSEAQPFSSPPSQSSSF